MKFLFASIGSFGDLHPLLAIALELKRRGHSVTLAAVGVYKEKIERAGLTYVELRPSLDDLGPENEWFSLAMHPIRGVRFVLRDVGFGYLRANYFLLLKSATEADVLVGQAVTFFIPLLAERLDKPWASLVLQPALFLSRHDPPFISGFKWPALIAKKIPFVYTVCVGLLRWAISGWLKPWHALRRELNLSGEAPNPLFEGQFSPDLTVALFSQAFAKSQLDWPKGVLQPGYAFYDADVSAQLSPGLEEFLKAGEPPLVFTLGTAAVMDARDFYRVAVQAAKELGSRAVLLVGRDARNREGLPTDNPLLFISDYEPYSQLFPRAQILIHQGGVGTTAQALASGRPQIIHPFAHDQPDNAARAARLGVSVTWPKRARGVSTLVSAVRKIQANPEFLRAAEGIRTQMIHENAVTVVADRLEQLRRS